MKENNQTQTHDFEQKSNKKAILSEFINRKKDI